jgi:transposase InsO family protein
MRGTRYRLKAGFNIRPASNSIASRSAVPMPMRTIKEEEVDLSEYQDYWDASQQIARFLEEVYMKKRIHSSLGYLTPVEFEHQWLVQQSVPEVIH